MGLQGGCPADAASDGADIAHLLRAKAKQINPLWKYEDARLPPYGTLTPEELAYWFKP